MSGAHIETHGEHNKGIALLISVLALVLAFSETLGKSAQTAAEQLDALAAGAALCVIGFFFPAALHLF